MNFALILFLLTAITGAAWLAFAPSLALLHRTDETVVA